MVTRVSAVLAALALIATAVADASITVARNAQRPALKVDARGYAEVSWSERGVRRFLVVPPRGRVFPGARLDGPDVSKAAREAVSLPFERVVRRTRDGRLWALQTWAKRAGGPVELRFSRWRGAPTKVELRTEAGRLEGRATFGGKPVFGYSPTPEGKRVRLFAFIDCFGCPAAPSRWQRLIGLALRAPDGSFAAALRPAWMGARYRATVEGPNRGVTYAPDGGTTVVATPSP